MMLEQEVKFALVHFHARLPTAAKSKAMCLCVAVCVCVTTHSASLHLFQVRNDGSKDTGHGIYD